MIPRKFNVALIIGLFPVVAFSADQDEKSLLRNSVSVEYSNFGFSRNDNDFIGSSEASDWNTFKLASQSIYDISNNTSVAVNLKFARYSTSGVEAGEIEDDSPKSDRQLAVSILRKIEEDKIVIAGVSRGQVRATQREEDAVKDFSTADVSFAHQLEDWSYVASLGSIFNGSQETQDALTKGHYYGFSVDRKITEKVRLGLSLDRFVGDEYDIDIRKSEQTSSVVGFFGEYELGGNYLRAGVRDYRNKRKDVEGSGLGEIEKSDGKGFFVSLTVPIGTSLTELEQFALMNRPNTIEFVNVGGSTMD